MENYTSKQMQAVCELGELSILLNDMVDYSNRTSEEELEAMFAMTKIERRAEELPFDDLMRLSFDTAHKVINNVSFKRRLQLLEELDYKLVHLYDATKAYNGQVFGKSMAPKVFQRIMGNIKHLEIIQNWLFGIE